MFEHKQHLQSYSTTLKVQSKGRYLLLKKSFLKDYTRKLMCFLLSLKKGQFLTCCKKKISVGYLELKLHIHTLGTTETYFTYCKKGLYTTPLMPTCQA